jgi:hypothetical protein
MTLLRQQSRPKTSLNKASTLPQQFLMISYNLSLPVVTSDLQKCLDAFYKIHESEEKALA